MKLCTSKGAIATLIFLSLASAPAIQPTSVTYCQSRAASTSKGFIEKVSIEGINNTSGNNGGYADYTALSTSLQRGAGYSIALTPGFVSGAANFEYWTVYIDYNQDGIFEPSEMIEGREAAIRIIRSFTVPASALTGRTRMRIQMQEGSQQTDPCAFYAYGEVEDYTVDITAGQAADKEGASQENSIAIGPNPAQGGAVRASYILAKNGEASLELRGMNGAVLRQIPLGQQAAGKHELLPGITLAGLRNGTYLVALVQGGRVVASTMLVMAH